MDITFNYIEVSIFTLVAWFIARAMFNKSRDKYITETLLSERLRTFLYLSLYSKQPISVLLMKPNQYINEAIVKSGVVTNIESGSQGSDWHQRYIGGKFSLGMKDRLGQEIYFDFSDIQAISLTTQENPRTFLDSSNTVNKIQHLRPFTGLGHISDSNETYCYKILMNFIRM